MTALDILRRVAQSRRVSIVDLRSPRRHASLVLVRWEAMWLLRKHTAMSLPEIGRFMNRDHSSVLHGIRRVETLVARNGEYRDDLNALADEQTFARALALEAA